MPERQSSVMSALGGMNQDDSLLKAGEVFQEDYRYARNCRIGSSIENNTGDVENLPSTLQISTYLIWNGSAWVVGAAPAGTNTGIGYPYSDKDEGAVYWAVFNSNGDHQILKFVKAERQIYQLLQWSGLNFAATNTINITKINKFLILTCREDGANGDPNPPRIIDTEEVFDLFFTLASTFSEFHISFAKWAPYMPIQVESNTSDTSEFMAKGQFQFTYRYVYRGGFRSCFAPPSIFASNEVTAVDLTSIFKLFIPGLTFNYNDSTFFSNNEAPFYEFVDFIEVAFRESTRSSWKLFLRHTVVAGDNTQIFFKNNGSIASVPADDINQYFDSVPFFSGACEAIDNRPNFGDNVDDIEVADFAVENVEVYTSNDTGSWWNTPVGGVFSGLSAGVQTILESINSVQQFTFKERGIYKCGIIFQYPASRTGLVISPDNWIYQIPASDPNSFLSGLIEGVHALGFTIPGSILPPEDAVAYQIVRTNCLNISFFIQGICNDVVRLGLTAAIADDPQQTPPEIQQIINDYNNGQLKGDLSLAERLAAYSREEVVVIPTTQAGRLYFNIRNWTNACYGGPTFVTKRSNDVFYNFQKGDRLRFIGSDNGTFTGNKWYDEEIVEFTGTGIIVNKPDGLNYIASRALSTGEQFAIEVYRPQKVSDQEKFVFHEMGEWYPITNARTPSRDFSKRDFTWTSAAAITSTTIGNPIFNKMPLRFGDCWVVEKSFFYDYINASYPGTATIDTFIQMNPDRKNAGGFWEKNEGRPLVSYSYTNVITEKPTQVRFGGKFLEDSIFLSINRFRDEWQFIYPAEYGRIRRMVNTSNAQVESVGNILLIHGEAESWSVYINRTTLEDLSGRTQVSISDKVLGSYNTLLGSQGTLNPESVTVHNGRVVWWNAKEGVWNRYSRDGITEISAIKMRNWFKDISDLLINAYSTGTPPRVISIFDSYHDEWITRFDHSSLPGTFKGYESYKCASFSEKPAQENGRKWKSVYDFAPDMFAELDNEVYSIIGAVVHIHEAGADFGNIYGSAVPSQLELVMADLPRQVKLPRVVTLDAQDGWSFERIIADHKSNSATVQETRIPLTSLELKEGVYWAEIKRDKNSPNAASETAGVVNGNEIKTKTLRFFLQLDPAVDYLSVLSWLSCEYDISPKNPKN